MSTNNTNLRDSTMKFATIENEGWTLENGEARHQECPSTFFIPTLSERTSLAAGDVVKLMFRFVTHDENDQGREEVVERMWVRVVEKVGEYYRGTLANTPYSTGPLTFGMDIVFEPRHVINIT
jgi:hypothetical protein